jgi:hypothetical protein
MRDAPTPPGSNDPLPNDRAEQIQAAAAEVLRRVEEWRASPAWTGSPADIRRYEITVRSLAPVSRGKAMSIAALTSTVDVVGAEWLVPRPGPTQAAFVAFQRIRELLADRKHRR